MDGKSIARINELSAIARSRALTREEALECAKLREAYLAEFRSRFKRQLDETVVRRPDGTEIPLREAARDGKENKG